MADRAGWRGSLGETGRIAAVGSEAARIGRGGAEKALAVALRRPDAPPALPGGRSARRRGTISPIFLACVATHKNNGAGRCLFGRPFPLKPGYML